MDHKKILCEVSKDIHLNSSLTPSEKQKVVHLITKAVNVLVRAERSKEDAN